MPIIPASPNLGTGPTNQQGPFPQPGSTTPTNQIIGPLPASTMPGQLAQTIPVMANFNFLLNALNGLQNQVNNITITPSPIHIDTTLPITGGPITATGTIGHATSGVVPGTYGDSANVAQVTVDKFGHVDFVADVPISSSGNFIQADYVLYPAGNGAITNYRLLTAGSNITITDGGAQGPVTISSTGNFFINGFTFGYGEPQNNQWIEFTPQTTTFFTSTGSTGGGSLNQTAYGEHRRLVVTAGTGSANQIAMQAVSGNTVSQLMFRSSTAFTGGFQIVMAQGVESTFASDARYCVGLGQYDTTNLPSPTNVTEPSSYILGLNSGANGALAILKDSTDTSLQLFTNDGLGHSTKVSLGILPTPSVDWYVISFIAQPGSSVIGWSVNNLATGSLLSGTTSTNLPPGVLRFIRYVDKGPTSTAQLAMAFGPYFWQNLY